jgi:hypothetical protein
MARPPRLHGWNHPLRDILGRSGNERELSCGHTVVLAESYIRHGSGVGKRMRCPECPVEGLRLTAKDLKCLGVAC